MVDVDWMDVVGQAAVEEAKVVAAVKVGQAAVAVLAGAVEVVVRKEAPLAVDG